MVADFDFVALGEVASVRSGFAFKSTDWRDSGIPVVKIANVKDGHLVMDGCSFVSQQVADVAQEFALREGDILIAMTGYIGDIALVRDSDLPAVLNQRVGRFFVSDPRRLDRPFLFYLLRESGIRKEIESLGYGSAQPNVSPSLIQGVTIPLPPLREQRAIAAILGALDDKIELNRKMSATLEAMARTLFKSWFVDFDPVRAKAEGRDPGLPPDIAALFPDAFEDSELGAIPKGWQIASVASIADVSRAAINPATCPDEIFNHYSIPAFDAKRLPVLEDGTAIKSNKLLVRQDSVLVSRLNPRTPRVWWTDVNGAHRSICSTEFAVMYPRKLSREWLYCLFSSSDFSESLATMVTGTSGSHQRVKPESLMAMQVTVPPESVAEPFTDVAAPVLSRAVHCLNESQTLAALRDALLPKLISGEIRVLDAERLVEQAV